MFSKNTRLKRFKQGSFARIILEAELLLILSLFASWLTCTLLSPNLPPPTGGKSIHRVRNYRILTGIIRQLNRIEISSGQPDLKYLANHLDHSLPEASFLDSVIRLDRARDLPERDIPKGIPELLRGVSGRDPYLWIDKNHLIYRWLDVTKQYDEISRRFLIHPPQSTPLRLRIFKAMIRTGRKKEARLLLSELFPRTALGRIQTDIPSGKRRAVTDSLSFDDWDRRFTHLSRTGRLSRIIREISDCPHRSLTEYFRGEVRYKRRQYERCRAHLARTTDPRILTRKTALLIKMDLRQAPEKSVWARVSSLQNDPEVHRMLLYDIAGLYLVGNQLNNALRAYSLLIRNTTHLDTRHWKALWVSGWIEIKLGRMKSARRLFRQGCDSPEPGYRMACCFWYQQLGGRKITSVSQAPFSYYFVSSKKHHTAGIRQGLQAFAMRLSLPVSGDTLSVVKRVRLLLDAGLISHARRYLAWGVKNQVRNTADRTLLSLISALLEHHFKRHYQAFVAYRRGIPDYHAIRLPRFLKGILVPLEYREIITRFSRERGLDSALVAALIREESMFRVDSRSHANAYGLMQMLPRTYAHLSGRRYSRQLRWELIRPEVNVRWGTLYLRRLLDKYSGKVPMALAAYNAGDHRVDRWLRNFGDVSTARFIEMIPFSETRNYVKNILRNRFYYRFYHDLPQPPGTRESI